MSENKFLDPDIDSLKKAISVIVPMSSADFEILLPLLRQRSIKRLDYILREGEVFKNIYFLIDGFVRMYYVDLDGSEISYRFTDKGHFFVDFQSLLTQQPSCYHWQATQSLNCMHCLIKMSSIYTTHHLHGIISAG